MSRNGSSNANGLGPQRLPEEERKLVEKHLPLVQHVLTRLPIRIPHSIEREDLYHEGVFGLMHAAQTYDHTKGATFKTYAYVSIRGAILDEIRRQDPVPRSRRDRLRAITRATDTLTDRLGREPTHEEIAVEAELKPEQVSAAVIRGNGPGHVSMDESVGSDDGGSSRLVDLVPAPSSPSPPREAETRELRERLKAAISTLPERDRRVVILNFAEGLILREIGEVLGITESRVSQIRKRALERLEAAIRGPDRPATQPSTGHGAGREAETTS